MLYEVITIVFERFMASAHRGTSLSQKCLFPEELHYSPEEAVMVQDLQPDLFLLGLELIAGDDGQFLVQSIPAGMEQVSAKQLIDGLLSDYSQAEVDLEREISEQLATSMAKRAAMPYDRFFTVHHQVVDKAGYQNIIEFWIRQQMSLLWF